MWTLTVNMLDKLQSIKPHWLGTEKGTMRDRQISLGKGNTHIIKSWGYWVEGSMGREQKEGDKKRYTEQDI